MRKLILFFALCLSLYSEVNSQALTDTTIMMTAFWEIGDQVVYEFRQTVDKFSKNEETLEESTYEVQVNIVDSTENQYLIEWRYANEQSNRKVSELEKELLKLCQDIPIRFSTDEFGSFKRIDNWEEMKEILETAVGSWLTDKKELPDSVKVNFQNMMEGLFQTSAQASYWANDIRFFHALYGINLPRKEPLTGIKLYTNPFIKETMPGYQRIKVVAVDEENYIARIKMESGIDGAEAKKLMIDFVEKNFEKLGLQSKDEINPEDIPEFSTTEEINCVYEITTGYILKGTYVKLVKVDDDYKRTTYEYKLRK